MRRRPSIDVGLMLGTLGAVGLVALAIYGPMVAPHDLNFVATLRNGKPPPFDPGPEFLLGTDEVGRDLWSWILIGARTTLVISLAAALIRVALGAFLGTMAGWQGGVLDLLLSRLALGFSSIPATVLAVLGVIAFNVYAGPLAFALALGLIGWGEAFHYARRQARAESGAAYIEAARSLGLGEERVVLRHLVPNIASGLIALTALQVSAVLLLLAELGLLQIFVGGAITEFTTLGAPVLVPSTPDWSSMLASTRPIRVVSGGSLWPLLAPATALVVAIGIVNLFGDSLARVAQRSDVVRFASRRKLGVLGLAAVVLIAPALLWPSPLGRDRDHARAFDAAGAHAFMRELAQPDLRGRPSGSAEAERAAGLLRDRIHGDLVPLHTQALTPDASLQAAGGRVSYGNDLDLVSLDDVNITAPAIATTSLAISRREVDVRGAIVVLNGLIVGNADHDATVAKNGGAVAIVYVAPGPLPFPQVTATYAVPIVRVAPEPLERIFERPLPDGFDRNRHEPTLMAERATLSVAVRYTPVSGTSVVARIPAAGGTTGAPVVVVVGTYEQPATAQRYLEPDPGWASASSASVLAAVTDRLRAAPLPAEVLVVAATAQEYDAAGLKQVLATLSTAERKRVAALVFIGAALGDPVIQPDVPDRSDPAATNASGRIARKVADALSLRTQAQRSRTLLLAERTADVSAPTFFVLGVSPQDTEPSPQDLRASGEAALTLVSYLAHRPVELQP